MNTSCSMYSDETMKILSNVINRVLILSFPGIFVMFLLKRLISLCGLYEKKNFKLSYSHWNDLPDTEMHHLVFPIVLAHNFIRN